MEIVCETERLYIRRFTTQDADFILKLFNEENFINNIADKKIRTTEDAVKYLVNGPLNSYQTYGFGLCLMVLKEFNTPIGMCGILTREEFKYPDLGYALLSAYCGKGFAYEASSSLIKSEMKMHDLATICAITSLNNLKSNSLLKKLGFNVVDNILFYGVQNNMYELNDFK